MHTLRSLEHATIRRQPEVLQGTAGGDIALDSNSLTLLSDSGLSPLP